MKRFALLFMLIGVGGILFGLGSCLHPAPDERTFAYEDSDADAAPYITGQRFIAGMLVGGGGFAIGAYLRGLARRKNPGP